MSSKVLFYAPNVHTGGGLVLLKSLLRSVPDSLQISFFLDQRAQDHLSIPADMKVRWVSPTITGRVAAEYQLVKFADSATLIFCFHGLPPVFQTSARTVVYLQNRLLLSKGRDSGSRLWTKARMIYERKVAFLRRHSVSDYIVQTPTMEHLLRRWYQVGDGCGLRVHLLPFMEQSEELDGLHVECEASTDYDFIFPASGDHHKGHAVLLEAWKILARDGLTPSLVLTLPANSTTLLRMISAGQREYSLNIHNLGVLPHSELMAVYRSSRALIFPSLTESFGLPLIEAKRLEMPILAGELDYVRDVCEPAETFDARSPMSIARAVKRYIGSPEPVIAPMSPPDFWRDFLREMIYATRST